MERRVNSPANNEWLEQDPQSIARFLRTCGDDVADGLARFVDEERSAVMQRLSTPLSTSVATWSIGAGVLGTSRRVDDDGPAEDIFGD